MKLSDWARKMGISYRRAWQMFKDGKLPNARQLPTGTIVVLEDQIEKEKPFLKEVAIYCRVSSHENKDNLERQAERLKEYAMARGYNIKHIVKEVGSGVNDTRPKLIKLLKQKDYGVLLVEHKDRLTRFGFNYLKLLAEDQGKTIEVVNCVEEEKEDLVQDFVAVIYSFSVKLYGLRRAKRKAEKIVNEIMSNDDD
ncbi:IS607 family transposase [Candidatus Caldatribacterium sp.]|uniref:IS607 family transposase n=1 Tax=Candidatus Caldatribacterium sp. TaxID=2282143 RepID=UPI00383F4499|nr:IS607 family transposase [Candidatus Caldatribacterium sp.]